MPAIIPHDFCGEHGKRAISYRAVGGILQRVAEQKGNNIVSAQILELVVSHSTFIIDCRL